MKFLKPLLFIILVAFIGIQFFRPEKNLSPATPGPDHLVRLHPPSADVQAILERACYDCHTNNTRYPWYAEIQPVAWWLDSHIRDGKRHFNFERFGSYSEKRQLHKLEELVEEVEEEEMPLPSYKLTHGDARLSEDEIDSLIAWAQAARTAISQP